jgi:hypothetical protein
MVKSTDKGYAMEEINEKMAKYGSTRLVKAAKDAGKAANKAAQQQIKNAGKEMAEEVVEEAGEKAVKNGVKTAVDKGAEITAQAGNELAERTR